MMTTKMFDECISFVGRMSKSLPKLAQKKEETNCHSNFGGVEWLHLEPFTTVVVPFVGELLEARDVAAMKSCCSSLNSATNSLNGFQIFNHVNKRIMDVDATRIQRSAVLSVDLGEEHRSGEELFDFSELVNCRTIFWRPSNWESAVPGHVIESPDFALQGLEKVKFRFYPRGKEHSHKNHCALYVSCKTTERDVVLRLKVGNVTHILNQRMDGNYVDGFVNFCDYIPQVFNGVLKIGLEVVVGPNDVETARMELSSAPKWAQWTIPNVKNKLTSVFQTGDRITSDTFSVDGLGEAACFVLYPKGDMVDSISKVGDFVNIGLFGGSDKDVTFRLTAGKVSKILTACADRYQSKVKGTTKSCGEFFDACFGTLEDMLDEDGSVRIYLEVIDTQSIHNMAVSNGEIVWSLKNASHLRDQFIQAQFSESVTSRYFGLTGVTDGFFALGARFVNSDTVEATVTKLHHKGSHSNSRMNFQLSVRAGENSESHSKACEFSGTRSTEKFTFRCTGWRPEENFVIAVRRLANE